MNLGRNLCVFALIISLIPSLALAAIDNVLDDQIISELAMADTRAANRKVEEIFIRVYADKFETLKQERGVAEAVAMVNAPVSGRAGENQHHLLSFATLGGFKKLVEWALNHGGRINASDKNNSTMLRMSIANHLYYMARFALKSGANPNLIVGDADSNMIGDLMKFRWPLRGFEMAWEHGARFESDKQRKELIDYLTKQKREPKSYYRLQTLINRFSIPGAISVKKMAKTITATQINLDMVDVMDQALLEAIYGGELPRAYLVAFNCHGTPLAHYLAINGMTNTLKLILSRAGGGGLVLQRDRNGNDLLSAAIKSQSVEVTRLVLGTSAVGVNRATPNREDYANVGDYPLHLAIKWGVSDEIFDLLFENGAGNSLNNKNASGLTPFELLESLLSQGSISQVDFERIRDALLQ